MRRIETMAQTGIEAAADTYGQAFTDEQKHYLQGFVSGAEVARARQGLPAFADTLASLGLAPPGPRAGASPAPTGRGSERGHSAPGGVIPQLPPPETPRPTEAEAIPG